MSVSGIAYGWVSAFDGLGSLAVLYIIRLMDVWYHLPSVIFLVLGASSLVCGYFFLPETKDQHLFDSLQQMDDALAKTDRRIFASREEKNWK